VIELLRSRLLLSFRELVRSESNSEAIRVNFDAAINLV